MDEGLPDRGGVHCAGLLVCAATCVTARIKPCPVRAGCIADTRAVGCRSYESTLSFFRPLNPFATFWLAGLLNAVAIMFPRAGSSLRWPQLPLSICNRHPPSNGNACGCKTASSSMRSLTTLSLTRPKLAKAACRKQMGIKGQDRPIFCCRLSSGVAMSVLPWSISK